MNRYRPIANLLQIKTDIPLPGQSETAITFRHNINVVRTSLLLVRLPGYPVRTDRTDDPEQYRTFAAPLPVYYGKILFVLTENRGNMVPSLRRVVELWKC